jgi:hypothetical protein
MTETDLTPGQEKCAIHGVAEIFVVGESSQCFECRHIYRDNMAILAAWKELTQHADDQFGSAIKMATADQTKIWTADDVPFCPLCLHDW